MRPTAIVLVASCGAAAPTPDVRNAVPTLTLYGRHTTSLGWADVTVTGSSARHRCAWLVGTTGVLRACSPEPLPPIHDHTPVAEIVVELDDDETHAEQRNYDRFASRHDCLAWASTVDTRADEETVPKVLRGEVTEARHRADQKCAELARYQADAAAKPPEVRRIVEGELRRACDEGRARVVSAEREAAVRRHWHPPRCV